ncbi:MAG: type II toxin-antitoxin system RelE/ParE family toxin [Spirochaetes bacterium]|nr:type II toxin-antitoxin system RelE/ParE family toxin [Spirochaetota bacterium]
MAVYSIFLKDSVRKDLDSISTADLKKIMEHIGSLAENPRPIGCEKLTAQEKYRIRQGNYRIIYSIQDTSLTVWVVKVGHRRDVYR